MTTTTTSSSYIEQKQTELFNELGVFFAFNDQQFKEGYENAKIEKPVRYVGVGHGMYCPKPNIDALIEGMKDIRENWKKDRKEKESVKLIFVGIDSWNRPVFKAKNERAYFGSVNELFSEEATEEEVLKKVDIFDLCYLGNSFGCEPMGTSVPDKYYI